MSSFSKNGSIIIVIVVVQELNSVEAIKTAVQCGLGAAFVSACAIQKELDLGLVARVDIAGVRLARGVLLVSNPHRAQPHPTFQVRLRHGRMVAEQHVLSGNVCTVDHRWMVDAILPSSLNALVER